MVNPNGRNEQKKLLKEIYGFEFPEDFWEFIKFYEEIKGTPNQKALEDFEGLGIIPTGPFDVIKGDFIGKEPKLPLTHHMRYRMDPPEFYTILLGRDDGLHFGYWVNDTRESDICIASYYNHDAYGIDYYGNNIFEMLRYRLEDMVGAFQQDMSSEDEEGKRYTKKILRRLSGLRNVLMKYGTGDRRLTGEEYCNCYEEEDSRTYMAPTWEGMGIRVPEETFECWDEKYFDGWNGPTAHSEDYMAEDIIRLCQHAETFLERGLYGNALHIGKNLWSFGRRYSEEATRILYQAYCGLGRENYAKLIQLHQLHGDRKYASIIDYEPLENGENQLI